MTGEVLRFTIRVIARKPVRSLLTVAQISLGIAAFALILNLLLLQQASEPVHFLPEGEAAIVVMNGQREKREDGSLVTSQTPLFTEEDIDFMRGIPGVIALPRREYLPHDQVQVDGMRYAIRSVAGVDQDFLSIADLDMIEGQPFTSADIEQGARLLMLSDTAARALFGQEQAVGRKVKFTSSFVMARVARTNVVDPAPTEYDFTVVGVFRSKDDQSIPNDLTVDHFLVPVGSLSLGATEPGEASVRTLSPMLSRVVLVVTAESRDEVERAITTQISSKYGDRASLIFEKVGSYAGPGMDRSFEIFLFGFALIGLVVSAIGILSTMMVSVVERTREVGLRRALGASKGRVVAEIVAEAILLSLIGALIGATVSVALARPLWQLLSRIVMIPGSEVGMSVLPVAISALASVGVGALAGLLPAVQAARMTAVDAMRQ